MTDAAASQPPNSPRERMAVAVCTYNRGPAIERTLERLAAIDRVPDATTGTPRITRILVIDNNSTDDTPRVVTRFAASCSAIPIEMVREPKQGLTSARLCAVASTDEEIIAFIDDDCLPEREWGAAILHRMDASPRAGAAGSRVALRFDSPPRPLTARERAMLAEQELGDAPLNLKDREAYLVGASLALRRSALEASGWLGRQLLADRAGAALSSGGDTEICVRIRAAGFELWYEPASRVEHLIPPFRTDPLYLLRLLRGMAYAEPTVRYLAHDRPGPAWIEAHARTARRRYWKTRLLEWRPRRRRTRLAEREGRIRGWTDLLERVRADPGFGAPLRPGRV